jgi:hypothetical protein
MIPGVLNMVCTDLAVNAALEYILFKKTQRESAQSKIGEFLDTVLFTSKNMK